MKDHQPQTFVSKHDLALLHKKIIATDLIVQKYQEANKALVALQVENEQLRQQVDQITNECCIFGKQVTECTQECDHLKEQIELLNAEKRQMHNQLRILQDENTNYYHEIIVLKQYESLKTINDESTRTIERQQKEISKLQLKLQRQTPLIYRPNKATQEPSEATIALVNSQKSIRELKLALGRLMNFLQTSMVEIPSALNIRPVLKAHSIDDDFLEIEGEFILQPVREKSKSTIALDAAADDDDDHGDFIDVTPVTSQASTVVSSMVSAQKSNATSKIISGELKKSNQSNKKKKTPKPSKKQRKDSREGLSRELDDLANQLEMAISQPNDLSETGPTKPISFSSDDDDDEVIKVSKPTTSSNSLVVPSPVIVRKPVTVTKTSTIQFTSKRSTTKKQTDQTINQDTFSLSDDDEQLSAPKSTSCIKQVPTASISSVQRKSSFMDILPSNDLNMADDLSRSIPFLSDDDDDRDRAPIKPKSPILGSSINFATATEVLNTSDTSTPMDTASSLIDSSPKPVYSTICPLLQSDIQPISTRDHSTDNVPPTVIVSCLTESCSSTKSNDATPQEIIITTRTSSVATVSSVPTIDAARKNLVLRLLNVLRNVPDRLEPVQLFHRQHHTTTIPEVKNIEKTTTEGQLTEPMDMTMAKTGVDISTDQDRSSPIEQSQAFEDTSTLAQESCSQIIDEQFKCVENELIQPENEILMDDVVEETANSPDSIPVEIEPVQTDPSTSMIEDTTTLPVNKIDVMSESVSTSLEQREQLTTLPDSNLDLIKPAYISLVNRFLTLLKQLPISPSHFRAKVSVNKRKRQSNVTPAPQPLATRPPPVNRASHSPTRIQTRSLTSIRACIARCNRPASSTTQKRPAQDSTPPTTTKRMKSSTIDFEANLLQKFIDQLSIELHEDLKKWIEDKLNENISRFIDYFYQLIGDTMIKKCDLILPLVKRLHPCEESLKLVIQFIHTKSTVFQKNLLTKLKQDFEVELKQHPIVNNRVKIMNRLFLLICSMFESSPNVIYGHLFDIGFYCPKDILSDALAFVQHHCSMLNYENSPNRLLHQTLFEIFSTESIQPSLKYFENLLETYLNCVHNYDDLIRSCLLICRHQTWTWCSDEFCAKLLLPLVERVEQRLTVLTLLQYVLLIYKDNGQFREDSIFRDQLKQVLLSLETVTDDECIVRDKIFVILHTCA